MGEQRGPVYSTAVCTTTKLITQVQFSEGTLQVTLINMVSNQGNATIVFHVDVVIQSVLSHPLRQRYCLTHQTAQILSLSLTHKGSFIVVISQKVLYCDYLMRSPTTNIGIVRSPHPGYFNHNPVYSALLRQQC